jgi:EAL and modified HD-GYP domain-containing signal transduction protein
MNDAPLLRRQPIVTRTRDTVGYDLALISAHGEHAPQGGMAALLAGAEKDQGFFARLPNRFAVADCAQVETERPDATAAGRFVLSLQPDKDIDDLPGLARNWKGVGFELCLDDAQAPTWPAEVLQSAGYLRLDSPALTGASAAASNRLRQYPGRQIASGVDTRAAFERAARAGCDLFQGYFFTEPSTAPAQAVNPGYDTVVGLMKLAQDNAPVARIEEALKRDAALSFKLLRYINSAGFGLSCEIHSFRHAVAVLGYQNLYKWLALLLVTAGRQQGHAALVTTAIARGRLAELLGQSLFESRDRDNLFLVGAFSLLHAILQMPLEQVTEQINLPEPVTEALLQHAGPFGTLLELLLSLERLEEPNNAARAQDLTRSLGLTAEAVNRAQLEALAWAEGFGR